MGEESYVLCLWGGRLWPAKVLVQRDQKPRRRKDIALEILGEEKRVSIPESQTWPLTQDRIDSLSLQLDQDVAQPMRELRYRKALRLAINVISTGDPCSSPTVRTQRKSCRLNLTGSPPAPTAVPGHQYFHARLPHRRPG
ncbi:hypothetical protein AGOR_G00237090 [Albula goreensis]|uniref:PWWP domain-containing protein n=1 Tax=Albula goreensis TaxID=1534307 RepID=A0A8T3CH40_9TELE|nr:hypothetical protein AGOR_G00237090 [Albula goreensis]